MVKSAATLLMLAVVLCAGVHAQAPMHVTPSALTAQDSGGTIWGAGDQEGGTIFRWHEKGGWQAYDLPETKGLTPSTIIRGDNGAVYVLWLPQNQAPGDVLITMHRGSVSRVLARFPAAATSYAPYGDMHLWAGVNGDVWVAGSLSVLRRISPAGVITTYPIKPEQRRGTLPAPDYSLCSPNGSVVDAQGRRWFWQSSNSWFGNDTTLRGVLIWDGQQLSYHATLPGMPDQPISLIERLDITHLWVALIGPYWANNAPPLPSGLYRLDTRTLESVCETPRKKLSARENWFLDSSLMNVRNIFRAHGDWYAVDCPTMNGLPKSLWRRQGTARWNRLTTLGKIGGYDYPTDKFPLFETPLGTWLGTRDASYFLPLKQKPPILVDWQRDWTHPLSIFYKLPSGRLFAVGSEKTNPTFLPSSPPPARTPPNGFDKGVKGFRDIMPGIFADGHRHLWMTGHYQTYGFPLEEWDGRRWRIHIAPNSKHRVPGITIQGLLAGDTKGRIWLTSQTWIPPTAPSDGITIYDPERNSWSSYSTPADALQTSASLPSVTLVPLHNVYLSMRLSGDGRAVYSEGEKVSLYDGHKWIRWSCNQIEQGYGYESSPGVPELLTIGTTKVLRIRLNGGSWSWTEVDGWRKVGRIPDPSPVYPPGGPKVLYSSPWLFGYQPLPTDTDGASWVRAEGTIYKYWRGLWTSHLSLNEPGSPFRDGRPVEQVFTDSRGKLFFMTRPNGRFELVSWMPPTPAKTPAPTIHVVPRDLESVKLTFAASQQLGNKLRWRLNGGEWKEAKMTLLTELPLGDYRVEALLIDASLQPVSPLSSAAFTIRPAAPQQVSGWVKALMFGDDKARNRAAAWLVKQGDKSLTPLKAARPGASEIGQWWIDSVTQQIEAVKTPAEPGL